LKTISLSEINHILAALTVLFCFLPLVITWKKNLFLFRPYLLISIFWAINGITYFPEIFSWEWYSKYLNDITYVYNLLETCQIILIFYYIFQNPIFIYLIFLFVLFEVTMIYLWGYVGADNIIIGVGCFITLILNIGAVIRYVFKSQPVNTEHALVFVYTGFAFYFTQFIITYTFVYLNFSRASLPYVVLINYLSICIATSLISFGIAKHPDSSAHE